MPLLVTRFVSSRFRRALATTLRDRPPGIVVIESPFLLSYVPAIRKESGARCVLRAQNVEFRIWEALAESERAPWRRFASARIAASLRRWELREMEAVDAVLPISKEDAGDFRRLGCTRPMHVVPCSIPLPPESPEQAIPLRVGFIGSLDYRANQQAVTWMLDAIWPRVKQRNAAAELVIAGSSPPAWLRERAAQQGVTLEANVADAQAFMRSAAVLIAPLLTGGGMRIKVAEAMALGRPVVATTVGAGGVAVTHGHDIFLADDPDSFAGAIAQLLQDRPMAHRLGAAARATIARHYDEAAVGEDVLRFFASL
jgi:glycosyltransferase involved in cell wall biosynthesis